MAYSHRDLRVLRSLGSGATVFLAAAIGLIVLALALPAAEVGFLAVVALGSVGGAYLIWSDRLTDAYARDLARVRAGASVPPPLKVEVESAVGFDGTFGERLGPSPHRRRGR